MGTSKHDSPASKLKEAIYAVAAAIALILVLSLAAISFYGGTEPFIKEVLSKSLFSAILGLATFVVGIIMGYSARKNDGEQQQSSTPSSPSLPNLTMDLKTWSIAFKKQQERKVVPGKITNIGTGSSGPFYLEGLVGSPMIRLVVIWPDKRRDELSMNQRSTPWVNISLNQNNSHPFKLVAYNPKSKGAMTSVPFSIQIRTVPYQFLILNSLCIRCES